MSQTCFQTSAIPKCKTTDWINRCIQYVDNNWKDLCSSLMPTCKVNVFQEGLMFSKKDQPA